MNEQLDRKTVMSLLGDDVPELKGKIKAAYLERQEAKRKRKRLALGIGVPVLACSLGLAIGLPIALGQGGAAPNPGTVIGNVTLAPKHSEIAFGVLSGSNFLSLESGNAPILGMLRVLAPKDVLEGRLNDLNPFMLTAETMMDNGFLIVPSELYYDPSEEYPYTMVIKEESRQISFHYSETSLGFDDDEEEFSIDGYYLVDGLRYEVAGKRERSVNGSESEYETEFMITLEDGEYLVIETETENEKNESEVSYSYAFYEGGREPSLEVSLSYEAEGAKTEMEVEVTTPGHEAQYLLDRIDESTISLRYEFESGNREYEGTIIVEVSSDGNNYVYTQGEDSIVLPRI